MCLRGLTVPATASLGINRACRWGCTPGSPALGHGNARTENPQLQVGGPGTSVDLASVEECKARTKNIRGKRLLGSQLPPWCCRPDSWGPPWSGVGVEGVAWSSDLGLIPALLSSQDYIRQVPPHPEPVSPLSNGQGTLEELSSAMTHVKGGPACLICLLMGQRPEHQPGGWEGFPWELSSSGEWGL